MEEILLLLASNPDKAITLLTSATKDIVKITDIRKEYYELDRSIRSTQVDKVQLNKTIQTASGKAEVASIKIPISFQSKIVKTATAFEVGGGIEVMPKKENELSDAIEILIRENRIESKLQEMIRLQKSELQCAMLFYIEEIKEGDISNTSSINEKEEIKVRILQNKNGIMSPYFDQNDAMIFFTWQFPTIESGKTINNTWIYSDKEVYKYNNKTGKMAADTEEPKGLHGFSKIPVVYCSQEDVEWSEVEPMIDRLEVAISKLGGANDYFAHPMLALYGEVKGMPEKDADGKVFRIPMVKDDEGKWNHGDIKFLEHSQAPESAKLEIELLEKYIYSISSTPDISFNNIKGIGGISGLAIQLMFLDAIIKAKMNEGKNKTLVDRIINVFISGIVTKLKTSLITAAKQTYFSVKFKTIIPKDLQTLVNTLAIAYEKGLASQETAVRGVALTNKPEEELAAIKADKTTKKQEI